MLIKGLTDEDFANYKVPSMFIAMPTCTFKCEKECGVCCCQNSTLAKSQSIDIDTDKLVRRYIKNDITKSVVFGGLEPMDSFTDVIVFIKILRERYDCNDTVVIYTGYKEDEIPDKIASLKAFENIVVKFGRFVPDQDSHKDDVLGVNLASDNQYAVKIS